MKKKTFHYCLKDLLYCLRNLKSLMQFIFEFVYFLILFLKTSFASLINLNRYFLKINIRFIHHISHYNCLVVDVASQYRCICSKSRNEIKFDSFNSKFQTQKLFVFFLNFLQSHAKNIFRNNSIDVSLRKIVDVS